VRFPKRTRLAFFGFDAGSAADAVAVVQQPTTWDVAAQTFVTSFTTRITGVIVGQVVAGAVLKLATDALRNKAKSFSEEKEKEKRKMEEKEKGGAVVAIPRGEAWAKLAACILIDFVGDTSFALPGIGELEDVAWAPASSFFIKSLLGSNTVAGIDFIKEALPGTDFIPVATLSWALTYLFPGNPIAQALGLPDPTRSKK
jgi:hypothetical protein